MKYQNLLKRLFKSLRLLFRQTRVAILYYICDNNMTEYRSAFDLNISLRFIYGLSRNHILAVDSAPMTDGLVRLPARLSGTR